MEILLPVALGLKYMLHRCACVCEEGRATSTTHNKNGFSTTENLREIIS